MTQSTSNARKTLRSAILIGAGLGVAIGVIAAVSLNLILSGIGLTDWGGFGAVLFIGFEAAFAGAIVGGAVAAVSAQPRNLKSSEPANDRASR